jgi:nucleoside-diphosphate-sugar epimerase
MGEAIVGSTGFVGAHLLRQHAFDFGFDSKTIRQSAGSAFDLVVCAAAPGSMFEANCLPQRDKARIDALVASLRELRAKTFVLISTIAVLADFDGGNDEGTADFQMAVAYGHHRRELETFCQEQFSRCLIVRLPALFGAGLKKNFLFDIMNPMPSMLAETNLEKMRDRLPGKLAAGLGEFYTYDDVLGLAVIDRAALNASVRRAEYDAVVSDLGLSAINFTNPESQFQFYEMNRLWADIVRGLERELEVLHLAPEPLAAGRVFATLTGRKMPETGARVHREDMRTRHGDLWGRSSFYMADADAVSVSLKRFLDSEVRIE